MSKVHDHLHGPMTAIKVDTHSITELCDRGAGRSSPRHGEKEENHQGRGSDAGELGAGGGEDTRR